MQRERTLVKIGLLLVLCIVFVSEIYASVKQKNSGAWVPVRTTSDTTPGERYGVASCTNGAGTYFTVAGSRKNFRGEAQEMLNDIWSFDARRSTWTMLAPSNAAGAPSPRIEASCVVIDQQVYLFGGYNLTNFFNDVFMFDTKTNSWSLLRVSSSDLPDGRFGASSFTYNSILYIFGGRSPSQFYNDVWQLDTKSPKWQKVSVASEMPSGRLGHASFVYGSSFFVYGGNSVDQFNVAHTLNDTWVLDIESAQWKQITPSASVTGEVPGPRYYTCHAFVGTNLWIFGGAKYDQQTKSVQILDDTYVFSVNGYEWSKALNVAKTAPTGRFECSGFYFGFPPSSLSIYGGITSISQPTANVTGDMWSFVVLQ